MNRMTEGTSAVVSYNGVRYGLWHDAEKSEVIRFFGDAEASGLSGEQVVAAYHLRHEFLFNQEKAFRLAPEFVLQMSRGTAKSWLISHGAKPLDADNIGEFRSVKKIPLPSMPDSKFTIKPRESKEISLKAIKIETEFNIPGTDIVLEKGDIVNIKAEKTATTVDDFPGLKRKIDHQFNGLFDVAMDKLVAFLDDDPQGKQILWRFIREG